VHDVLLQCLFIADLGISIVKTQPPLQGKGEEQDGRDRVGKEETPRKSREGDWHDNDQRLLSAYQRIVAIVSIPSGIQDDRYVQGFIFFPEHATRI
jgi:hypothetical protein